MTEDRSYPGGFKFEVTRTDGTTHVTYISHDNCLSTPEADGGMPASYLVKKISLMMGLVDWSKEHGIKKITLRSIPSGKEPQGLSKEENDL